MGRDVRRVPLDFDWPLNKTWKGFIFTDEERERLVEDECPDCELGYGPEAYHMYRQWYGNVPFSPADKGSTPHTAETPAVRRFAERNVSHAPNFYGTGEAAILREANRLATLWNGQWGHHLSQEEVDFLVNDDEDGGIRNLTHTWDKETKKYIRIERDTPLTAQQVNEWSLESFFNDIPWYRLVLWHCEKMGVSDRCLTCDGHASIERFPGQRDEAEAWEATEPPEGEGWQVWETVSEGSPITPVFETPEGLARHLYSPAHSRDTFSSYESALNFVNAGFAPSAVSNSTGFYEGAEFVGTHTN